MVLIQRARVKAPLPDMAAGMIHGIPVGSEPSMYLLKTAGKAVLGSRHRDEMDMIGHQAVADEVYTMAPDSLKQQVEIDAALGVGFEDEAPGVATLCDVMSNFEGNDACESHYFMTLFPLIAALAVQRHELRVNVLPAFLKRSSN